MKQYKLITCCGDCAMYNWKKHRCTAGAEDEGRPQDNFYADCPLKDGKPKRITVKPFLCEYETRTGVGAYYICTSCGLRLTHSQNYCSRCGSHLDWRVEE